MSDLPAQGLFQQLNAKHVSGEHLEVLGKRASALWSSGSASTLSEAVIGVVKQAGLSPEQVKRVIEFANTEAYLTEFKKEGSHRVVSFAGGPANPSEVFKDLNDGGGGSVFDRGTGDYKHPPSQVKTSSISSESMDKTASVEGSPDAFEAFLTSTSGSAEYPYANPYGEVMDLRDKLASQYDSLTSEIGGLESAYADLAERVYFGVKQAALAGRTLGEVVQVWSTAIPSADHVKLAFELFTPRLLREQVFHTAQELLDSTEKTGSVRMVNSKHPMVTDYQEYCEVLSKLAQARGAREEVKEALGELTLSLKQAAVIPAITGAASRAGKSVGSAGKNVAEKIIGAGDGADMVGSALEKATKYSPHAAAVIGANEVRRHLKYSPTWNKFQSVANPQSDQYRQREYEIAARGTGGGYGGGY